MAAGRPGSIVITDANILTMDPQRPTARALVIHDGIVTYIGSDEGAKTEDRGVDVRLDAKGRTLIPGFNDAHGHFVHDGLMARRCDLSDARSLEDALTRIRAYSAANPNLEIVVAERWDESDWSRRVFPTKADLDRVEPDRPLLARRVDGHVAVANTPLLALYDERYKGKPELIDHDTGVLLEDPSLIFSELFPVPQAELLDGIGTFIQKAHRHGVTSAQDFATRDYWRAWQQYRLDRDRDGENLGVRVDVATYLDHFDAYLGAGLITGSGDDWLAVGGLKLFLDGSLGAYSAYLSEPYEDQPDNHGVPTFTDDELHDLVRRAHHGGLQLRNHVIGDAATEQGTRAFEQVAEEVGLDAFRAMRHRFEHYEMNTPDQRRRAKTLGLVLSVQPNFVGAWATAEGMYGERLGARHRHCNPFALYEREGLHYAFGSDTMPFGPLIGIRGAMTGPYPEMRLDFVQCVRAYTQRAAHAQHREHVKGMLRPGMLGDCVLFTKDMSTEDLAHPSCLDGLDVAVTVLDGHIVYGD